MIPEKRACVTVDPDAVEKLTEIGHVVCFSVQLRDGELCFSHIAVPDENFPKMFPEEK